MAAKKPASKLNAQQALFVEHYVVHRNATQAAISAGYSEKTAYSQGGRLLNHVEVAKAIKAGTAKVSAKVAVDAEYVLRGLKKEAECAENNGATRVQAFRHIGHSLGMFTDKVEHSGDFKINFNPVLVNPACEAGGAGGVDSEEDQNE